MSMAALLRRWLHLKAPRILNPRRYWEERHRSHIGSLRAVGHMCLADQANAEQYDVKRSQIAGMIKRHMPDPRDRTLLDAGCGIGLLTPAYLECGFNVTGVDFSATAIDRARASGGSAELIVSPIAHLALGRSFDVVTAIDVLLHIIQDSQWDDTFSSLSKHLKPQGVLVILDCFANVPHDPAAHCRQRSLRHYEDALAMHGLEIVDHVRFRLKHEGAIKDLIAARRVPCPLL